MVVLWLVAILGVVAAALSFHSRTELRLTSFQWDQSRLTQTARRKAAEATQCIEKSSGPLTLAELSQWEARLFPTKAEAYSADSPHPAYLSDEFSRINLNKATKETLERLTGSRDMAAAIIDWRDPDSDVSLGGAEGAYYQSLPNPYPCRNGPFQSVAELMLVKGMTPDLYREIKNKFTVQGAGLVNINTAPRDVLGFLGLSTALVGKVVTYRKGPDGLDGTADDRVFLTRASVPEELEKGRPLTESDKASWQAVESRMTVQSSAIRLAFPVTPEYSPSARWCQIVLDPTAGPHALQSWQEGTFTPEVGIE